jgi:hypothetical protein
LKKEGTQADIAELPVTIRASWQDNVIGKSSSVSFGLSEEDTYENPNDLYPYLTPQRLVRLAREGELRMQTRMQKIFMRFKEYVSHNKSY